MAFGSKVEMDTVDWTLVQALQRNARLTFAQLGREVGLSPPAVAERVRRLEDEGVLVGYRAVVDPQRLGFEVSAMVRMRCPGDCAMLGAKLATVPEATDCHRVAGEDSAIVHVVASSVTHLEDIINRLQRFGATTTLLVLQNPFSGRPIDRSMLSSQPLRTAPRKLVRARQAVARRKRAR